MIVVLLAAGLVLLYVGAEMLVKGAVAIARRLNVGPLVIGLTIVAFGTSAPELTVSLQAGLSGAGDIAVTNVVGSNIFNLAVILGLSALICPIRISAQVIRVDMPIMIGVSLVGLAVLNDHTLSRIEGVLLTFGIAAYTIFSFCLARRNPSDVLAHELEQMLQEPPLRPAHSIGLSVAAVIAGLVLLVLGAKSLIAGSLRLARLMGLSEAIIGLTIVSVGTSLPELATSIVAAIRRQPDIAVGNVVGSNIFNLLAILGLTSVIVPFSAAGLTVIDTTVMLGTAVLTLPLMFTGFTLTRKEGLLLLLVYLGYIAYRWPK
jgi:cation:H+ antiporter